MEFYRSHILVCSADEPEIQVAAAELTAALRKEIKKQGLGGSVQVLETVDQELAETAPNLIIYPEGTVYGKVTIADVEEILVSHIKQGQIVDRLLHFFRADGQGICASGRCLFRRRHCGDCYGA